MNEQLKSDMSSLADRVASVDLTDRVGRTARRLSMARHGVTGFTVLILAGGATLGYTALPAGSPAAAGAEEIEAAQMVLRSGDIPRGQTGEMDYAVWQPESEPRFIELEHEIYEDSDKVSPDGSMLSYVGVDDELHVIDLDTGDEIDIPEAERNFQDVPLSEYDFPTVIPNWSPDSQRLWVDTGIGDEEERYGFVDVGTGAFTTAYAPSDWFDIQVTVDPDGHERLLGLREDDDGTAELVDVDTIDSGDVRVLSDDSFFEEDPSHIDSATPDGSRLCVVTEPTGDPNESYCLYMAEFDEDSQQYSIPDYWGPYVFTHGADHCVEQAWIERGVNELRLVDCADPEAALDTATVDDSLAEQGFLLVSYRS